MNDSAPQSEAVTGPRRAAFIFIFITVVLDMLSLGMIIPVLPKLVENFLGGDTARAAEVFGVFSTAWALMQFLFSPFLGALSDSFGRRPLVLISNFGLGLDYVLMALAPNLWWLFIGRVISGITSATVPTAFAYITDVTPPDQRAAKFGLISAAFGLGFVLGPGLGGVLGSIDPRLPFWLAAVLSLLNGCYGLFVLPESLPREQRSAFDWKRANPVGALKLLRSHPELSGLASAVFLIDVAHVVLPSIWVLYAGYRYGWDEKAVGLSLAVVGICSVIVQAGLVGPIVKAFGERRAMVLGLASGAAGFFCFGVAETATMFLFGIPLLALWGIVNPAINGLMTRHVGHSEQGRLQGANNSIQGIANLVGPFIFTLTFAWAIGSGKDWNFPGAPFVLSAVFLVAAAALGWHATRQRH
ncbi:TCR/Tet family MFS transporter [Rhodoplanes sp. Z2-YC6860]|uniref:TCR/Tet family MFS transporter n=1 Tax=Rhodoplanes sp. Z2-YC6860 TaxID=674703 RepID=UPI00078D2CB3|nr:TCR/Tet family MFS transporter [Rhodoplanes sp. Z2-YC6860]AMN42948.1 tetracycline efflux transporter [Rhodoplanes sp. Z2-YC6860]